MAIVLEANYAKKIGLAGFSSHQYSVSIRTELADIERVPEESERIYRLLQDRVDAEIQNAGWLPGEAGDGNGNGQANGNGHARGSGSNGNGRGAQWACSPKQRELILKIADEHQVDKNDIEALALERFDKSVTALNRMEASGLIDELLSAYGNKRNGNGRRSHAGGRR